MLEIVQAGQSGKTPYLFDMHRLRKRVFKDRLNWEVSVTETGLEVDEFDLPEAVYLLSLDDNKRVIGNWRMLPTTGPTMIRDVWPDFLRTINMPRNSHVWEMSRFAVDSLSQDVRRNIKQINEATAELFCGLTELCILCGIQEVYTMYDERIGRLLKRLNCDPTTISDVSTVDNKPAWVGSFKTDEVMLERLRAASGIKSELIQLDMLPPALAHLKNSYISEQGVIEADNNVEIIGKIAHAVKSNPISTLYARDRVTV